MKTKLSIILFGAFFAFSLTSVQAQDTRIGLKGGAALYTTTGSISAFGTSIEEKSDPHFGFAAGLFVEKPFSDIISGQFEVLYVQKGGKDELDDTDFEDAEIEDGNLTLSYIDVPVMVKVNVPVEGNVSPFLYGGGFAGYLLDAQAESGGESIDEEGFELKDLLKDINYGFVLGGGVSFGKISLDIRYDMGLANIFDSESDLIQDLLDEFGDVEGGDEIQDLLDGIEITTSGFLFTLGVSF